MYRTMQIQVRSDNKLFSYFDQIAHKSNDLHNTALFYARQLLTGSKKPAEEITDNEKQVLEGIKSVLPNRDERPFLFYKEMNAVLYSCKNEAYFAKGLPRQTSEQILKVVCRDMKSFFNAMNDFKENPSKYTGKPELPHYKKKGGVCSYSLTNQDCVIKTSKDKSGKTVYSAKLPLIKDRLVLGYSIPGRLMEVQVKPYHGIYIVCFVFDDGIKQPALSEKPERICAIDFGIDNIAAMTNNIGLPNLLFKGGVFKSQNQWYNKQAAKIVSEQTKGTTDKFVPNEAFHKVCVKRENQFVDFSRKVTKQIIDFCVENKIDTLVLGRNKLWKQESNIGSQNNQAFVQMPIYRLLLSIKTKAAANGIRIVEQEESYTSKASYLDNDVIPVYGKEPENLSFSGKRKPHGERGLYQTADGTIINSDLNGSANIGRKAFPDLYTGNVQFANTIVIKHPDYETRSTNRAKQLKANKLEDGTKKVSKSKALRLEKKSLPRYRAS